MLSIFLSPCKTQEKVSSETMSPFKREIYSAVIQNASPVKCIGFTFYSALIKLLPLLSDLIEKLTCVSQLCSIDAMHCMANGDIQA